MDNKQQVWESYRAKAHQADRFLEEKIAALEDIAVINTDKFSGKKNDRNEAFSCGNGQAFGRGQPTTSMGASASNPESQLEVIHRDFEQVRAEVSVALQHFDAILGGMVEAARALLPNPAPLTHTERFQQLAMEKRKALSRVSANFKRRCEFVELLPKVNDELEAHREGASVQLLIKEHQSLQHAHRRLNGILGQAESAHERLRWQREIFLRVDHTLNEIAHRVPILKDILAKIDSRRRRSAVILGGVIGFCLLVMVFFI
ncbi:putative Snare region anchored in the vesicle membrane C terminus [Trypanosoma vivax]|uniref:Putative GOLGI SNAP receptor complex member n=1 Tax=Trypanosoma vivax (strain Y486) TaxID=1055687 RepID=G0UCR9_TRYVY|nr:putative GOLGI SNAP receptor complex member [Trypanosoma vivax]KAH8608087.1 putative Snare region anchored in the vesicle membrane C terminus [Trypanosoma vivax]CCC53629.1 putative GOLGI SNAP receptor complex member [Trypanosoma vivax Y486]